MRILLGVTGGIAVYKAVELMRLLQKDGHTVRVCMTEAATEFVAPLTFQALSEEPVWVHEFRHQGFTGSSREALSHIDLAKWAELIVIAPATANTIAKMAAGIADNLLTSALLAATSPVVLCPAMNNNMYAHPSTQANLETLRSRKVDIIEPDIGRLACGDFARGKLPDPKFIADFLKKYTKKASYKDIRIVVTAGPTVEPIDPVRYISNRSSGRMGYAVAEAALLEGAHVSLISGPVSIESPVDNLIHVQTAAEMLATVQKAVENCDILIMTAAVADYTPEAAKPQKIKKSGNTLDLVLKPTEDILKAISKDKKNNQIFVGFAAESEKLDEYAQNKLAAKNLDMIVANDISRSDIGFNSEDNEVTVFYKNMPPENFSKAPKKEIARKILDRAVKLLRENRHTE